MAYIHVALVAALTVRNSPMLLLRERRGPIEVRAFLTPWDGVESCLSDLLCEVSEDQIVGAWTIHDKPQIRRQNMTATTAMGRALLQARSYKLVSGKIQSTALYPDNE